MRELLLRTSILTRVSGPLADFLTGAFGSERILQQLEDANAFVSSLDVGNTWFRYHPLFAELLQLELRRTSPTLIRSLHQAAAEWHEQEGYVVDAIRHAQAAREWLPGLAPGPGRPPPGFGLGRPHAHGLGAAERVPC